MLSRLQSHRYASASAFVVVILALIFLSDKVRLPEYKIAVAEGALSINATSSLRIRIPSVSISASVENVGLTKSGAMDVPKDPMVVGLFSAGKRPGEIGTAVMSGHFGWYKNKPAAFDNLGSVQIGDKIYIEEGASKIVFIVQSTHFYGKDEVVPEVFYSNDGKAHLNLITCSGAWSATEMSYSDRWVVFSEKD
ncbi:MAG: hypothetical protein RLZZ67_402 [Candidatus Parcubacteria bacterium]|jgi:LPXTG-site transpeptidase (sortase) family protein